MILSLIKGNFTHKEAMELITELIHVKIKFHENKIKLADQEEDIKMREKRIKQLQKELYEVKNYIDRKKGNISLFGEISLNN
jgi:hypothetical protein